MTHPNLLHIVRSCAKWRGGSLLVATLFPLLVVGAAALGKDRLSEGAAAVATSVSTLVLPKLDTLTIGESRIVCAFKQFDTTRVAQWSQDRAACDSIYRKYVPAAKRQVSALQQVHTDSLTVTCVTWTTTDTAIRLTPLGPCSAAAWVTAVTATP